MNSELTSKKTMVGAAFVMIPRGTPGHGRISYLTGKGAFGKSAKLGFDLIDVSLSGLPIPVTGHYRIEGQGNTGAAVGAAVALGVFGVFVTGRSAAAAQGSERKASTVQPISITVTERRPPEIAQRSPLKTPPANAQPATVIKGGAPSIGKTGQRPK